MSILRTKAWLWEVKYKIHDQRFPFGTETWVDYVYTAKRPNASTVRKFHAECRRKELYPTQQLRIIHAWAIEPQPYTDYGPRLIETICPYPGTN